MNDKYLVINGGSSSLKFSLYAMPEKEVIVNGIVEKIGIPGSSYTLKSNEGKIEEETPVKNHTEAVNVMLDALQKNHFIEDISEIKGVGHRVLHGGEFYSDSVVIDSEVLNNIKALTKLGPIHHPGEIAGIESMQTLLPGIPQVAVFDTAFHQTMPKENYMYAVPYSWYEENSVRKYGFHGTSHKYITKTMQEKLGTKNVNLIICHIGSGASISCIKDGKCLNTTMGLTPLDGLVMGTRCGQIDPSILEYICHERNLTIEQVTEALNHESGIKGIGGESDFRDLEAKALAGDENAQLALKMFKDSIVKFIAQYYFELNGDVDAIVFTAGIGENSYGLREDIVNTISRPLGITLDKEANDNISRRSKYQEGEITTSDSPIKVMVIPTDEESVILDDTVRLSEAKEKSKVFEKK